MTTQRLTAFALGVLLAAAPLAAFGADTTTTLEQIVTDAGRVRSEAQEMRQLLRAKAPDFALVQQRLTTLDSHATALKRSLDAFEASGEAMTPMQRAAFDRARAATDTLHVLLSHKTTMLADTAVAMRNRGLLRAQADGIARRADMVQQHILRVRG